LLLAALGSCSHPGSALRPVPLPHVRHGGCVENIDGGLLAFGGSVLGGEGNQTLWLAPGAEVWQPRAPMQRGRTFFVSVMIDGEVYAIGADVELYDAANDRWFSICDSGKLPRTHFAAAAVGREIFVLGGYPLERSGFWIVDVDAGTVRAATPPPGFEPGDHFHFMACLDGELHVVGGLRGGGPLSSHHVREGESWRALPPSPVGLFTKFGGGLVRDGEWWLFVGLDVIGNYRFEPATGWRSCRGWDGSIGMPALVLAGDEIWCLGGWSAEGPQRSLLRVYDLADDRWREPD